MRRIIRFLTEMDAKAWRTLAVSFVLFGGVGVVFLFGAQVLGFDGEATVERWLGLASDGPWALPVAVPRWRRKRFVCPARKRRCATRLPRRSTPCKPVNA